MRVAINGFGRIGRSVFRILDKRADAELVAINDVFDHDALRYLLNYDTVMGRFQGALRLEGDEMVTSHGRTRMLREKDPLKLPWRELAIDVVIESTGIFTMNYGEAGAITVLGRRRGLPPALSGHNNFWLWGPGGRSGDVMIVVGGEPEDNQRVFRDLVRVGTVRSRYAMPYEQNRAIYIGRGLKIPLRELWPRLKTYI